MTLIVDAQVVGPPIHVFVVGVSRYQHVEDGADPTQAGIDSGLRQLTSAARSASEFAAWAMRCLPADRLASVSVHLAPTNGESLHTDVESRLDAPPDATRGSVIAGWRTFYGRCAQARDATAYVYVAGHGVQLGKEGAIVLLEDFGAPGEAVFWAALDLPGMSRTLRGSDTAGTQFWFVDCCRERTDAQQYGLATLNRAYVGNDEPEGECDAAPIFFAAFPRTLAWARTGGVSLFCEGLLKALERDAATDPEDGGKWRVTTGSLARALDTHVRRESGDLRQKVHLAGHVSTTAEVVYQFESPPRARLIVTLDPVDAHDIATADILSDDVPVFEGGADPPMDWPIDCELDSGLYIIRVDGQSQYPNATKAVRLTPPSKSPEVRLA